MEKAKGKLREPPIGRGHKLEPARDPGSRQQRGVNVKAHSIGVPGAFAQRGFLPGIETTRMDAVGTGISRPPKTAGDTRQ